MKAKIYRTAVIEFVDLIEEYCITYNEWPKQNNEENKTYIGSVSYEDVSLILALRHYPNLYNKLLKDPKRSASVINKRLTGNK